MMAMGALVLYVVFVALGFGWRSWRQYRRTGSTGFHGISGRPGTPEWFAGIGFVVAMVLGLLAPALQVLGVVSPIVAAEVTILQALGTVLAVMGIAATLHAQNDMGESWRIGVDVREAPTLVRGGVFALVRNPIFTAMLGFATGIALMVPNVVALGGFGPLCRVDRSAGPLGGGALPSACSRRLLPVLWSGRRPVPAGAWAA